MSTSNKQVVCLSTSYWDDPWYRKQQFMHRFHKNGYKIAYVEPSFSMVRRAENSKEKYATNRIATSMIMEIKDNLFIIKPPRYMPYWTRPLVSKFNFAYLSCHIQKALKKIGFKNYILWIYTPQFVHGLRILKYSKLIFDITDDLAAYNYENKSKRIYLDSCMKSLAKKSDLSFVTASTLLQKFKEVSPNIHLIPNGYESSLFTKGKKYAMPADLEKIPPPRIGFVGTIFRFLDYELIKFIVSRNRDKSFVFIGNCEEEVREEWVSITKSNKNVFWIGRKRKEEIPGYLYHFDLCINPFRVDDVSRSVSPLKVFEYLAMKKPVVSVRMESLEKEQVAPHIYFASSYEDFNKNIGIALNEKDDFAINLDYGKVKAYSWDDLFSEVKQFVEEL